MSISIRLEDGFFGTGAGGGIDPDGFVYVTNSNVPPAQVANNVRLFRQFLTTDGTAGGGSDMRTASTTDYFVSAATDADRYITNLSFSIVDASAVLNKFGNVTALTNGCVLTIEDQALGNVTISSTLKSNFDFVRLCAGDPAFGDGAGAFRASNILSTFEGYLPVLDFRKVFGVSWGMRLPKATNLKINLQVRDDTSGVEGFDCIAYGFDRII